MGYAGQAFGWEVQSVTVRGAGDLPIRLKHLECSSHVVLDVAEAGLVVGRVHLKPLHGEEVGMAFGQPPVELGMSLNPHFLSPRKTD